MRRNGGCKNNHTAPAYLCGRYSRYGKEYCSTHTIREPLLEKLVLTDIQNQIDMVINEPEIREKLLEKKQGMNAARDNSDKKRMHEIEKRVAELDGLIQSVYEDKFVGKIPEKVCVDLLEKYQAEKDRMSVTLTNISAA